MTLRAFILQPTIVFQAVVATSPSDSAYPIDEVTFDTVTVGAYTDILPGQMVTFGVNSNHGIQRIRKAATADTLYIGRTSKGYGYSEVFLFGDSQITVWDLRAVWTKPYFEDIDVSASPPTRTHYKDGDIAYSDQTIEPPPVANCGPGTMATIAAGIITVEFDGTNSFAVADGATISSYLWGVGDGTITVGTSASDTITATFPAGFRYVSLTVTDSNGKSHVSYCPVFARNPASDAAIPIDGLTIRRGQEGQEATVQLTRPLPESTYPDNTLVMIADGEPSSAGDRSHIVFLGWHHRDSASHRAERTGYITGASLTCLDVAGKMQVVHGFSQEVSHAATPATWGEMATANMDKFMHYLLQWHSNALELADWTWSGTGATYALYRRVANPGSLWDQVKTQAEEMNPTYRLTCNSLGQLAVIVDPMVVASISRTSTIQATISEADWSNIRYDHERYPSTFWLWGGAARAGNVLNSDGEIDLVFCVAPGNAPGIGYTEMRDEVGIAPSQGLLNTTYGHRYARMNAPERPFRVTLAGGNDHGIQPANMTWVQLTVGQDAAAAPRGLALSAARGLPLELSLRWNVTRTGVVKSVEMVWERETIGSDAVTVVPQANEHEVDTGLPDSYYDDNAGAIIELITSPFYGDPMMYVLWDGAHVLRTADIMPSSPTWEIVATKDTDFTGFIMDGRYVIKDDETVGMWLLTTLGVYWCDDIMATTPVWEEKLTNATIQATEPTPATGVVVVKCMTPYASEPGFLCIATGPLTDTTVNVGIQHAYFWHTHDFGDTWTPVDSGAIIGGPDSSYCYSAPFAMEMFRSAATIYCLRSTPRSILNMDRAVLVSTDGGHNWEKRFADFLEQTNTFDTYSLLHPFPSDTDASYAVVGDVGVSNMPDIYRSRNEWEDIAIQLTDNGDPTGYGGVIPLWRVNKKTDVGHVMAWFKHTSSSNVHLLESYDYGDTWSSLYEPPGITSRATGISNCNVASDGISTGGSTYNTPNGWPADDDVWFMVRAQDDSPMGTDVVQMTTDDFVTVESRAGNISTLLSGVWTESPCNGFALPKLGVNS